MSIRLFKVGGCVRDELLKRQPNDIDYAIECGSYQTMKDYLVNSHVKIFHEIPAQVTIRGHMFGQACDFVMCKKAGSYKDTEADLKPGLILDDLGRRDFRFNSIAKSSEGEFIDPFDGRTDLLTQTIRLTAGLQTLIDDPLRLIRAIRFQVTLPGTWTCDDELEKAMQNPEIVNLLSEIAIERIQVELEKSFSCNTLLTLHLLNHYPLIAQRIFSGQHSRMWLKPSVEKRKK